MSNFVLLVLNDVPFVKQRLESLVGLHVLVSQVAHLFHIDLFKQSCNIDALNDFYDLLV